MANIDGDWKITIHSPMGAQNVTLSLKADGGTLTGMQEFIDGQFANIRDAGAIEDSILDAAKKAGLPIPRYIRPKGGAEFTRD